MRFASFHQMPPSTSTKLISLTHPTLNFAHRTFESYVWNNIIRAHAQSPVSVQPPLSVFARMRSHGVEPDFHTFPFLLQSFHSVPHLQSGRQIHAQVFVFGLDRDTFVQTCLINMYSSCGDSALARRVFDEIAEPDLPSWNSVINVCLKVGRSDAARALLDEMPARNVISWSCMINGYVRCGESKEALALFREMQLVEGALVRPNEFTMSGVLLTCGRLGALEHGKWAHAYINKCGIEVNVVLGTCLINMYAKCGSIERARLVFGNLGSDGLESIILGLAMHGHAGECLGLFSDMIQQGLKSNSVTYLGILCACDHGGLMTQGKEYFRKMSEEHGITLMIQHYGCLVDLFGRAGLIKEAWAVVKLMPVEPDVLIWGALLSGSRTHGDIETCEIALRKLIQLDPGNSGAYVLLSNVYAKLGRWNEVRQVRNLMEAKGIYNVPGCSLVELDGVLHEFFVGDHSHPDCKEIYMMLDEIMVKLKKAGYVGNTKEVLLDLDEEAKELALSLRSEKLAMAFCFLKTSAGTTIQIIKNLRICGDCHVAIKMISKVYGRKIVIRDCNLFHHFNDGVCSCKDFW
ncbi:hypothetical protein BT93_K0904 [Corymbia citriodora subsp. variegata]|nr:hypothetical protein BT93_K0904 [Corymbia citriodora subsp. variegata]